MFTKFQQFTNNQQPALVPGEPESLGQGTGSWDPHPRQTLTTLSHHPPLYLVSVNPWARGPAADTLTPTRPSPRSVITKEYLCIKNWQRPPSSLLHLSFAVESQKQGKRHQSLCWQNGELFLYGVYTAQSFVWGVHYRVGLFHTLKKVMYLHVLPSSHS